MSAIPGTPSTRRDAARSGWRLGLAVGGIALLVRLFRLSAQGLWFDETYTVLIARLPLRTAWEALVADGVHPPLFYLVERAVVWVSSTETAVRLPSAILGALAAPLALILGGRWAGRGAGVVAGLLVALSPMHVWHSQDARMYAILSTAVLGCLIAFDDLLRGEGRRQRVLFVAIHSIAYLLHYFAWMTALVEFAFLAARLRAYPKVLRRWAVLQAFSAAPFLFWVYVLSQRGGHFFGIGWVPTPAVEDLVYTIINLTVGYTQPLGTWQWLGVALWCIFAALGLRSVWRTPDRRLLTAVWAFGPLLLTFILSLRRPVYVDRFFLGSLPALAFLTAAGVVSLHRKYALVVGGLLAATALLGLGRFWYGEGMAKEQWREAGGYLARAESGEVIIPRVFQIVVPLSYYYAGPLSLDAMEINRRITSLDELAADADGTWLVYWNASADAHRAASAGVFDPGQENDPQAASWLAGRGPPLLERVDFVGVTLLHFGGLPR